MNRSTLNAINKRIAKGETNFTIGGRWYSVDARGNLWRYGDYSDSRIGDCLGAVEDGHLNQDKVVFH